MNADNARETASTHSVRRYLDRWTVALLVLTAVAIALGFRDHEPSGIVGKARVIDGSTIEIDGRQIRLLSTRTPVATWPRTEDGKPEAPDQASANELAALIGDAPIACVQISRDQNGETIANCYTETTHLNGWLSGRSSGRK